MNDHIALDAPDFPDKSFVELDKSDNVEDLSRTSSEYLIPMIALYATIVEKLDATFKDVIPKLAGDQFEDD